MKNILFYTVLFAALSCTAQKKEATAVIDEAGELIGVTNKESFYQAPFSDWFITNYEDYTFDEKIIDKLETILNDVTIKAFMGTWCEDSHEQVPVFYKILDAAKFNLNNLEMVAVNREKATPDNLQEGLDIQRVPTFIFYKNEKEIGRFVEYPRETVEADILKIVSGEPYKHSYDN